MTRTEVSDYVESLRSQIEVNAQLYAVQKAMFLIQAQDKQSSSCLIRKWDGNPQFESLVDELKTRYSAAYGESFDAQPFACGPEAGLVEEVKFRDLNCATISQDEVLSRLKDNSLEEGVRKFYGICLSQKAYQKHESWFQFNISETNRLIEDVVAASDGQMAETLRTLKLDMEAKKVGVDQ